MNHKKWFEKKVDERQERDLLQVEHYCFWAMYWMLFVAMVVQAVFTENGIAQAAGEWVIFMVISILMVIGCLRKGVWSFYTQKVPGIFSYLVYSAVAAVILGIPFGILFGIKYHSHGEGMAAGILSCVAVYGVLIFFCSFVVFWGVGGLAKKREKRLAEQEFEDGEE